jgi:hypothetical protein
MTTQIELKKTVKQYEIDERRKQVSIMIVKGMTEIAIAEQLGVDNSTISKDIKALKLISQQFIYDIAKSDFTFYYKQCVDLVRFVLQKQIEIVEKEVMTSQDVIRAKMLLDLLGTVGTLNEYLKEGKDLHRTPIQLGYDAERYGIRPGTKVSKISEEEFDEQLRMEQEEDRKQQLEYERLDDEAEVEAEEEDLRQKMRMIERNAAKVKRLQEQARKLEEHKRKFAFGGNSSISP